MHAQRPTRGDVRWTFGLGYDRPEEAETEDIINPNHGVYWLMSDFFSAIHTQARSWANPAQTKQASQMIGQAVPFLTDLAARLGDPTLIQRDPSLANYPRSQPGEQITSLPNSSSK